MKRNISIVLMLLVIGALTACSGGGGTGNELVDKVIRSQDNIFRGIETGMTRDQVKAAEDETGIVDDEEDHLYYDFKLNDQDSYTISYEFYSGALYEIKLTTYFDAVETATGLYEGLKSSFDGKYGKSEMSDDGYDIWKTTASNGNNVEIALKDDSDAYGFVELYVNDLDY